ncbi:hypothetical protein QQP08_007131 [Theobroma cacao]|nr:hypothetical protein QQP08_007131 [Theobroma cacao]
MMQVESHENIEYEALIGGEAKFPERLANKIFSITFGYTLNKLALDNNVCKSWDVPGSIKMVLLARKVTDLNIFPSDVNRYD